MQIIKNKTNIDFIGKRRPALFISTIVNLAILVGIAVVGFNFGVDFAGGTVVELKFPYSITDHDVREAATQGGLHDPTVQGIGSSSENSFLLRMGGTTQLSEQTLKAAEAAIAGLKVEDKPAEISNVTHDLENGLVQFRSKQKLDIAAVKTAVEASGTGVNQVRELGQAATGLFEYQVVSAGMREKVEASLKDGLVKKGKEGTFEVRRVDYVGPQVGKQLRNKGLMAILLAMIMILVYVAFRFDFQFAPGAIVAMLHDIIMVAGYFLISRREFNLTSIAVLLTILGYSINDTIVVYDRIREEMVRFKGKPLPEIINIAVNDTLSRTILTSGVTALSLVGLLIFGVGEIWDFAMAMLIGIIVGTYSSVYIASPLTIWLEERATARRSAGKGGAVKAKPA
jgi:preprotein translocase subunit SecF